MTTFIHQYTNGSKSAKALSEKMGVKRMLREGSTVKNAASVTIINWGDGDFPIRKWNKARVINKPAAVLRAVNKVAAFQAMERVKVSIPAFTTDYSVAAGWIRDGEQVVARATATGHSSAGLTIHTDMKNLPKSSALYTKYIPKKSEFRVHVVDGKVIAIQQKVFPAGKDSKNVDWRIRDVKQGFVFASREKVALPSKNIATAAIDAVDALGLDFGGVDVIYNEDRGVFVLEVNTAPGIDGTDLASYSKALTTLINKKAA